MPTIIAALASTFFGMAFTLPRPWCYLSAYMAASLIVILRGL